MQLANTPPLQSTTPGLHPVSIRQMVPPVQGNTHPITAYYSVYRPRKDERLSRPGWLVTYQYKVPTPGVEPGHVTHPSTNRARRRVTSLIWPTPLPLRHDATQNRKCIACLRIVNHDLVQQGGSAYIKCVLCIFYKCILVISCSNQPWDKNPPFGRLLTATKCGNKCKNVCLYQQMWSALGGLCPWTRMAAQILLALHSSSRFLSGSSLQKSSTPLV